MATSGPEQRGARHGGRPDDTNQRKNALYTAAPRLWGDLDGRALHNLTLGGKTEMKGKFIGTI